MTKAKLTLSQALIGLMPLVYIISIWKKLPESVPLHYNGNFEVDRFGSKSELLFVVIFMYVISIGVNLLILNIDKIDPKRKYEDNNSLIRKFSWILTIFMTAISFFIVVSTEKYVKEEAVMFSGKIIIALVALLFSAIGNLMNSIRPNYFIGIRTPWNLENEENWKLTHRLASKLWFFGGLILFVLIVLLPDEAASFLMMAILIPITFIPFIYSYRIYKNNKQLN